MNRVVVEKALWQKIEGDFRQAGSSETGVMALARVSNTPNGFRLLLFDVIPTDQSAFESQGSDHLRPTAQWISSAIGSAIDSDSALLFVHTHPGAGHPPDLSPLDRRTALQLAPVIGSIKNAFAFLVWSSSGVAGWLFDSTELSSPQTLESFQVVGEGQVRELVTLPSASRPELDDRQIRALGENLNSQVQRAQIGVVGAGGTGSPLAEQLARAGIGGLVLIDDDLVDAPSNLRRIAGATVEDLHARRAKVEVLKRHIVSFGLGTNVQALKGDVRSKEIGERLLDCSLVINATDTHSSRALVNQLSYQYWLPTIDVGVRIGISGHQIVGMPAEVRVLLPDNGCLWCRRVLSADRIREENLPVKERLVLAEEGYVQGVGEPQPSLISLNNFAASLAAMTAIRLISSQAISSSWYIADPWELFVHEIDAEIRSDCVCSGWRGIADIEPIPYMSRRSSD